MTDGAHARPTVLLGFTLPEAPAAGDRAQEYANKRLFLEAAGRLFVDHDLSAFDQFYAAEYVSRSPGRAERAREFGLTHRQLTRAFFEQLLAAFPDVRLTIDQLFSEGDKVIAFSTWRGTHRGSFMGMPASGRPAAIRTADIFRVSGGQFHEHWDVADQSDLMPSPGLT